MPNAADALTLLLNEKKAGRVPAKGMVAAPQPLAAEVGAEILRAGGNAVDAAIGTGWAQGIVDPFMCGVGGFGCMIVHNAADGKTTAIDFHGRAGSLARPDVFAADVIGQIHGHGERYEVRGDVNQIGHRSVVVPGTPAGFAAAHRNFGRLPWHVLFEPAIELARGGIALPGEVYDRWVELVEPGHRSGWDRIHATPACAAIFAPGGELLRPGEKLRQPDYANTLERLAKFGAEDLYRGDLAHVIAEDFGRNNGLFDASDLASYAPDQHAPAAGRYRGHDIFASPLPASGTQLVQMLNVLQHADLGALYRYDEAMYVHLVARTMLAGFADRARHLGDPRFVSAPVDRLCSPEYAAELFERVCGDDPIEIPGLPYREARTTTNVCVIDAEGNAVAMTHTLGSASGVVTPGLGFVYNNAMYQFNPLPGKPNSIAPGKSRLTGITPTVVLRNGRAWAAIGGLGGTRILTAVMHVLLNLIDHKMSPIEAVDAPRFHAESPWLEMETRLYHRLRRSLEERNWRIRPSARGYDRAFAVAQVVLRDGDGSGDGFKAGSDPRSGGGMSRA